MKNIINIKTSKMIALTCLLGLLFQTSYSYAQTDSTVQKETVIKKAPKPVKNTFPGVWIIDNQTVMVPVKGTFEMDIQHRFGIMTKGYKDFWGLFAPSNIRLGVSYAPINKLYVGIGVTKSNMLWDASAKYSLLTQTPGVYPVSITYYGNMAYDTREDVTIYDGSTIKHESDKLSFFNQLIIARKMSDKLSLQIAPSISHQNAVSGYYTKNDSTGQDIFQTMKNSHFAISFAGRYKLTNVTSLIFNYDQPITKHATNNPRPNLALGFEFNTSNHSFQLFFGNYSLLSPQRNNLFNQNTAFNYTDGGTGKKYDGGQFLIGFNITRLWNY